MPQLRQLAAIMFTDIVGYTTLMGHDEGKAFQLLNRNRQLQKPFIEQFNGKWIKELGDGVMASFSSVSDAVHAAIKIQEACAKANEFKLRIGIHLGEVVFENEDVFGDGVNIASRIQSAASPGSIYVSESVYQNLANKKEFRTVFVKEEILKNVKGPIRTYEVLVGDQNEATPFINAIGETSNGKSIAVLPFVNMSNDPEQEFFCDGITEEIINALARLNNLRVIARTSVFSFKGKNVDVREIGKTLNVQTLLEGSVRKSGKHLRISTKLVKASDGSHLWTDQYDRMLEDVFAIQENIAENVATALKGYLSNKEKDSIKRPETSFAAYEFFLKGRQFMHRLLLDDAKEMFEKALTLDPDYAPACAGLADVHSWLYEWYGSKLHDLVAAKKNAAKALSLAPNLSESHTSNGYVLSLAKEYERAEQAFQTAIQMNPNSFDAFYFYGRLSFAMGKIEQSADLFMKASAVQLEDFQSVLLLAQSLRILNRPDWMEVAREGITRARKQLELNPEDRRALSLTSINLLETGNREEGKEWAEKALSLYPDDVGVLINSVCFYARYGDKQKALDLIEIVFGKGFGKKDWIEHDPDYDSLRDEPRFIELLNKLQ